MGFAARLSLFFAAIFLLIGCHLPYFPVWLDARGLSAEQIGVVLAAPLAVRIFLTPFIAFGADRIGNRRLMLILLAWGALASFLLFLAAGKFLTIVTVAIIAAVFWTSIMPITEAVAMDGVRRAGLDYGRMRLWGSLTFIAANVAGGVILDRFGTQSALWMMITAAAGVVVAAHLLPRPAGRGRLRKITELPQIRLRDALELVRSPLFLLFLVTTGAAQSAHAVYYAFGTLHWQSQGISTGVIGLLWAVGVVAEILLFLYSRKVVERVGPVGLIGFASAAAVLRWAITAYSSSLWVLFPVQALHGLTFGAAHLGAVHFITQAVPEKTLGTAQGLYASVTAGIAMGGAILASGPLYHALGARAYLVMAVLGAMAACGAWLLKRRWDGGELFSLDRR